MGSSSNSKSDEVNHVNDLVSVDSLPEKNPSVEKEKEFQHSDEGSSERKTSKPSNQQEVFPVMELECDQLVSNVEDQLPVEKDENLALVSLPVEKDENLALVSLPVEEQKIEEENLGLLSLPTTTASLFSPIFSIREEIIIVKGYYKVWKRNVKSFKWPKFYEYTDKKFKRKFDHKQIYEKVRRLKEKFIKNYTCSVEFPEGSHEAIMFEYSKILWKELAEKNITKNKRKRVENVKVDTEEQEAPKKSCKLEVDDLFLKQFALPDNLRRNSTSSEGEIWRKLEQEWGALIKEEIELSLRKTNFLIGAQRMILEKTKGTN